MEYVNLGMTQERVSRVAFGCWAIGGHGYGQVDDRESERAIRCALDAGINIFDTADVYGFGRSETVLGRALGSRRHDVVIATKFGVRWGTNGAIIKDCSPSYLAQAVEGSLKRLRVDAITLYQIHWHDGVTPLPRLMEALARLKEQGKIRHIGCTNFDASLTRDGSAEHRLETIQLPFGLNERNHGSELRRCHEEERMATLVYGVLARGFFREEGDRRTFTDPNDTRSRDPIFSERVDEHRRLLAALRELGSRYGKTPGQVAIRWALDNPFVSCVLVGMKSCAQVAENAGAAGWCLDPEDFSELTRLMDAGK